MKFNIYNFLKLLFGVTLLLEFRKIWSGIKLVFVSIYEMIFKFSEFYNKVNISYLDFIISIILYFIILFFIITKFKKSKFLKSKVSITNSIVIIVVFMALFSPIVTDFSPNYQNNISTSKFLSPFSQITIFKVEKKEKGFFDELISEVINPETNLYYYSVNFNKEKRDSFAINIVGKDYSIVHKKGIDKNLHSMKRTFLFGTDELGRDLFSRIIFGARVSLFIATLTVILSTLIGILLGYFAAVGGKFLNIFLSRITDAFLAIPAIFFVIMILAFWGNSLTGVIIVLSLTGWMSIFKIVKFEVISIMNKDYFITSKKLGLSSAKLLLKEIMPVLIAPLSVALVFQFSNIILAESALSFLGLGVGINYPSWGNLILSGQKYMDSAWWILFFPSLALVSILLSLNSIGEKIKKKLNPIIELNEN